MKKLCITLFACSLILSTSLNGQYSQIGIRSSYYGSIFYQITNEAGNAEIGYNGMLNLNKNSIRLTGLRIIYGPAFSDISPDLYFGVGYGAHLGIIYEERAGYRPESYEFHDQQLWPLLGVDGWFAVEYRFRNIPVNLNLNVKPYIELAIPDYIRFAPFDFGLSASYVF